MKTNITRRNRTADELFFSKSPSSKKSLINVEYLKEMSGDNGSFISAMLCAFRDESNIFLRQMERVLADQDFLSMQRIAHRMKPSGAYIGADALTVLVANLEKAAERTSASEATSLFNGIKSLLKSIFTEIDNYLN